MPVDFIPNVTEHNHFLLVRIKKIFPVALVLFPLHLSKIFNDLTRLSIIAENSMSIFSIQDTYRRRHAWKYVEKELEDRVKPSLISVIEQNLETTWLARSATTEWRLITRERSRKPDASRTKEISLTALIFSRGGEIFI